MLHVHSQEVEAVRAAVRERGLNPVARALRVPRSSLASVLADGARAGTVALVIERWRALQASEVRP